MIENIKVSETVIKKPKNKFVFHLKVMHGDADLDEMKDIEMDDEKEALLYWNFFLTYFEHKFNTEFAEQEDIDEVMKERGKELGIEYCEDMFNESVGPDITCSFDRMATIRSMWLTYFDEDGIEYGVEKPKKLGW